MMNRMLQKAKNKVKTLRINWYVNKANKIAKLIKQYENSKITLDTFKQYYFTYIRK